MIDPIVIDFETAPLISGSGRSPAPVGVSILIPGEANTYISWGHPGANPHTFEMGKRAVAAMWDFPLAFHNCKFDIGVAMEHMGLPWPRNYDDTMFSSYLVDPLADKLGLKELAARWLQMPAEERDAVFLWLKENFKGPFLPDHKQITTTNAGAYISYAPYEVVAPYAMGDTLRTQGLHRLLRPKVTLMGMDAAYERELKIARIGYWMERVGVRVDRESLSRDYERYAEIHKQQSDVVQGYLGDIDITKPKEVAQAILDKGYAASLPTTPTGKLSTAGGSFEENVTEPTLLKALRYRSTLHTLTSTFYKGWLAYSEGDGHLHPSWNQVRSGAGSFVKGARTGRFSCDVPNLQNVPTEFDSEVLQGLDIPFMRQYILPDDGHVIVPADYNGQEMRVMAHYAEGKAAQIYRDDPQADFHKVASALIQQVTGLTVPRKMCKIVGFSLIYGSGVQTLANQLGVSYDQAARIKGAYFKAIPGLQEFIWLFKNRPSIKTWGDRILPCEPAKEVDGEWRTYNYKLVNYLIQGSAADQGKEALIRYDETLSSGRTLMFVHDEPVISMPREAMITEVPLLTEAMEGMSGWDVPFRAEVAYGANWHQLKEYK